MNWLFNRLKEPSTWRGLIWLLTAFGVSLSPEAWEYVMTIGMALAGLVGVLSSDKPARVSIVLPEIELQGQATPYRPVGHSIPVLDERVSEPELQTRDDVSSAIRSTLNHDSYGG